MRCLVKLLNVHVPQSRWCATRKHASALASRTRHTSAQASVLRSSHATKSTPATEYHNGSYIQAYRRDSASPPSHKATITYPTKAHRARCILHNPARACDAKLDTPSTTAQALCHSHQ